MPWFPEFSHAIELARRGAQAQGREDPVAQYLKALNDGGPRTLERVWPGEVVIHDPRAGEIRGHRQLRTFIHDNRVWMTAHESRINAFASISVGQRAVVELMAHILHNGTEVAWPMAVVAESPDERSVDFRTYCSQWPVDGVRHVRPPVLEAGEVGTRDVVARQLEALARGDLESLVANFAPDGYVREPIGPDSVHRGPDELRAYYAGRFGNGHISLQPCAAVDDGVRCALEYNLIGLGAPQAALAVFERTPDGLLAAIRLYDDIDRSMVSS